METLLRILERAGGYRPALYLKIENPPYMALVIEAIGAGPCGLSAISVAHYGEMNGDTMRDPEMCFELVKPVASKLYLDPYCWRNDYVAIEQWSRSIVQGRYVASIGLHSQHERFAADWDRNLKVQGLAEAFTDKSIRG